MAAVFEKARREVPDAKAVLAVAPVRLSVSKWRFGGSLGSFGRPFFGLLSRSAWLLCWLKPSIIIVHSILHSVQGAFKIL